MDQPAAVSARELHLLCEEARRLLERITSPPWAWEPIAEKSNEFAVGQAFREDGTPIEGRISEGEWIEDTVIERRNVVGMNESGHANFADAEFIAAAPRLVRSFLDSHASLTAQRDALLEALKGLANEARGLMGAYDVGLRQLAGHSNVECLRRRVVEAEAALSQATETR